MYLYIYDVSGVRNEMWGLGKRRGETRKGFSGVDCSASHELKE
jgi:hypothetical protein